MTQYCFFKDSHSDRNLNALVNWCCIYVTLKGRQAEFNYYSPKSSNEINVKGVYPSRERQETVFLEKDQTTFYDLKIPHDLVTVYLDLPICQHSSIYITHRILVVLFSQDSESLQILFLFFGQLPLPANYQSFKDQGAHSQGNLPDLLFFSGLAFEHASLVLSSNLESIECLFSPNLKSWW